MATSNEAKQAALAHYNRGVVLQEAGRHAEALAAYDAALSYKADFVEALNNRGNALSELKRHEEALASFDRALAERPGFAESHNNRGVTLYELRRFDEALASHDRALAFKPDDAEGLNNRANVLHALRRQDEALQCYARAASIAPAYAQTYWNQALARLRAGDFRVGWQLYEWGWRAGYRGIERRFREPRWTGAEPITGKTILLHAEQALGDTLQFARYAPVFAGMGARPVIEAQPPLVPLLSGMVGVAAVVSRGKPLPPFDFHIPLLSVPLALETDLNSIPAHVPYLRAPEASLARWRERLPRGEGLSVGLAWSGREKPDPDRSIALAQFAPLFDLPGIRFVSLQKDLPEGDEPALAGHPLLPLGPELKDFTDTAAAIAQLDLVISIDTAVAHLAGALGKPVWILLPVLADWRWLLDRTDSPWYPTARLFRQDRPRAWEPVIARVREALAGLTSRKSEVESRK